MAKPRRKIARKILAALILAAALLWMGDWALLAHKVARDQDAFGQVQVRRSYAVHLRNKRIEQDMGKPTMEECVHSLFPHYDESPCWYLRRHAVSSEKLDGRPWHFWYE